MVANQVAPEVEISYLGMDVGGTKVALLIEGARRPALSSAFAWPDSCDPARDLRALRDHLATIHSPAETIESVGIAMPATLDRAGQVVAWPGRPSWQGLALGEQLRQLFAGARVSWADDGDLAAVAEAREAGCANLVYLGVGTGIGGGVVIDGRSVPGLGRGSAELGHVIVERGGAVCDCGRRGCVQALASGPATLRRAARLRGRAVTPTALVRACQDGEAWATASVAESAAALASLVTSLTEIFQPSLVLVGGGFAAALPVLTTDIRDHVQRLARPGQPVVPVRPAALGALSSLHGAALLARGLAEA